MSFIRTPPPETVKGKPGTDQHKSSVLEYANAMYEYHLHSPYTFGVPTEGTHFNAFRVRKGIIEGYGYKPVPRPGGMYLKWVGVPQRITPLDHLRKDFRAGKNLEKEIYREGRLTENLLRLESEDYKYMGDTRAQANTSRRATEISKIYGDYTEMVRRNPKKYGKLYLKDPKLARKRIELEELKAAGIKSRKRKTATERKRSIRGGLL